MNTIELFSSMLQEGKEIFLSAEDLLTMFNRNISKNTELLDYIGKKNIFEVIGKTRNEGVHSYFTFWIYFFTGLLKKIKLQRSMSISRNKY